MESCVGPYVSPGTALGGRPDGSSTFVWAGFSIQEAALQSPAHPSPRNLPCTQQRLRQTRCVNPAPGLVLWKRGPLRALHTATAWRQQGQRHQPVEGGRTGPRPEAKSFQWQQTEKGNRDWPCFLRDVLLVPGLGRSQRSGCHTYLALARSGRHMDHTLHRKPLFLNPNKEPLGGGLAEAPQVPPARSLGGQSTAQGGCSGCL